MYEIPITWITAPKAGDWSRSLCRRYAGPMPTVSTRLTDTPAWLDRRPGGGSFGQPAGQALRRERDGRRRDRAPRTDTPGAHAPARTPQCAPSRKADAACPNLA